MLAPLSAAGCVATLILAAGLKLTALGMVVEWTARC